MTPAIGPFGTVLYQELLPLTYGDEATGWALLYYLDGIGSMVDEVEEWARDGANGEPGWSIIVDINRAPLKALPWLGQMVGVTVDASVDEDTQRDQVRLVSGFARGTPAALVAAAQRHLTGTKDVIMIERWNGDAYSLYMATRTAQTPNSAQTLADILLEKPAGVTLTYETITGQTFNELLTDHATMQNVYTSYATLQDVLFGTESGVAPREYGDGNYGDGTYGGN